MKKKIIIITKINVKKYKTKNIYIVVETKIEKIIIIVCRNEEINVEKKVEKQIDLEIRPVNMLERKEKKIQIIVVDVDTF